MAQWSCLNDLLEPSRRNKTLELLLKQPRKVNAGMIAILRADDLDANRQTFTGKSAWRHRRRQIGIP